MYSTRYIIEVLANALADYHNQALLCGRIITALEPYKEGESFLSQKRKEE